MSTRVISALPVGAALSAVALAGPATAATYPTPTPKCTVTPTTAKTGATVSIVGVGFTAGATVGVKGTGVAVVVAASGQADKNGAVSISGKASGVGSGTFILSSGVQSATCSVKVDPVAPASVARTSPSPVPVAPVTLPRTGATGVGLELGIGGALLAAGAGALVLSARRRSA